jgi:hypothetical protein
VNKPVATDGLAGAGIANMSRDTLYNFAYGSNLHPVRLVERVPSARLLGTSSLNGYRIEFHKLSRDGSGKCDLYYTGDVADVVHGAIYEIDSVHKSVLDRFEGKGAGYIDTGLSVKAGGQLIDCFAYIAQAEYIDSGLLPYHWYKDLVVSGARHLGFPDDYVSFIERVASIEDPDTVRNQEHSELLGRMLRY